MIDLQRLSRAEMKKVLAGVGGGHPCSFYLCNIDFTHGVCPNTCACGPLTIEGLPPNEREYVPCVDPNS